ncbi:MAG: hypothetical protein K6T86_17715 [Pirellulales bacterium]|nr:hypothetical protein [Pirellulales bacterium]
MRRGVIAAFRKHIRAAPWFWFLIDPQIDAPTWSAEQAIRPAVVNRKVWGGHPACAGWRTWVRAPLRAILMSLLATPEQRGHVPPEWLSAARRASAPLPLPP